jgi:Ca2+-binding RTX toxin-like protein
MVLALPGAATASSVSIGTTPGQLTYTGDSTSNSVTIAWGGTPSMYTVTDSAPLTAGPVSGCVQLTPTSASCPDLNVTSIRASLAPSTNGADTANSITLDPTLPDNEPATVNGGAGVDTFNGQAAAETFNGADGNDVASGGAGADTLSGDVGGDTLSGGAGDDALYGYNLVNSNPSRDGNDALHGDDGSDVLTGHWGSDDLDGGSGIDRADYGDKRDFDPIGVTLDDDTTRNDGGASDGTIGNRDIVRTNVEWVFGGHGADTIVDAVTTSSVANTFNGRSGSDVMSGGLGADTLQGTDGNDTLNGERAGVTAESDSDQLQGGAGTDTVTYSNRTQNLRITLDGSANDGTFVGVSQEGDNVASDVERVVGGSGNDAIEAQATNVGNVLSGGAGADTIDGKDGDDTLNGDAGQDSLTGGAGIDAFFGGDDDDDIFARDTTPETVVDCGAGTGDLAQVDPVIDLTTGCELIE